MSSQEKPIAHAIVLDVISYIFSVRPVFTKTEICCFISLTTTPNCINSLVIWFWRHEMNSTRER